MDNIANSVLIQAPDYSTHNMTEELKTTTHLGRLTPIYCQEVVPGDSVDINAEFLTKFQPMVTPAFQNYHAYVHYFYVPMRVLWPNFEFFIQNEKAPGALATPVHPFVNLTTEPPSLFTAPSYLSVYNYFGLYTNVNTDMINPLPFAAYQLIYNEYYRHPQIHQDNKQSCVLSDGDNAVRLPLLRAIRYRTWKNDYFTAALKNPQLGNEAALDLVTNSMLPVLRNQNPLNNIIQIPGTDLGTGLPANTEIANKITTDPNIGGNDAYVDPTSANFQITMNDLINLQRMQEFLVRKNISGNRYIEYVKSIFGIDVPDLRLHRPDYICGIKAPVTISEVLNTGNAVEQGMQSGQGNSYAEGGRKNYKVLEHGLIIGIYSCLPTLSQMFAVNKLMFKNEFTEYYAPIFDQMGEVEVKNKELVLDHTNPDGTFGYMPKYGEYRVPFHKVTGEFQTSLTTWHEAPAWPNNVTLNEQFFDIYNPHRVFQNGPIIADAILLWLSNNIYITRPMKKYAMPVLSNNYGNNLY